MITQARPQQRPDRGSLSGPIWLDDLPLQPKADWLIDRVFGVGDLSTVFGPPGSFKSYMAVDMGMHVAMGQSWQGRAVKRGGVVYLPLEGGRGLWNRMLAQRLSHGERPGPDGARIPFALWPRHLDLCGSDGNDLKNFIATVTGHFEHSDVPLALIIIDTLQRALGVGDENVGADMNRLLRNMAAIQDATGAHVLLVHHTGKEVRRGPRGHSALLGAVDTAIELRRADDSDIATATIVKQRDADDGVAFSFRLKPIVLGADENGEPITSCVVEQTEYRGRPSHDDLSGQPAHALRCLAGLISSYGRTAPSAHPEIPEGTLVVEAEEWRRCCDENGLTQSPAADARRKAFSRARRILIESGHVKESGSLVWMPPPQSATPRDTVTNRDKPEVRHAGASGTDVTPPLGGVTPDAPGDIVADDHAPSSDGGVE